MRMVNYLIFIGTLFGLILFGCSNKPASLSSSKKSKQDNPDKNKISNSTTQQMDNTEENFQFIVEKDIFTPSELRRRSESGNQETVEIEYVPQKLTITGIVNDGDKYLVSVENRETGDSEYLGENEKMAGSTIQSINEDEVKVKKRDFILTYKVGDEILLEGTRSRTPRSSSRSSMETSNSVDSIEVEKEELLPPAANSIEEMLRQRRLQEEEELK